MEFSQTANAQFQSQLFQLPREILLQICTPLLYQPEVLAISPRPWLHSHHCCEEWQPAEPMPIYRQTWHFTPAILRCDQLLHQIGHSILYGGNTLAIDWTFGHNDLCGVLYDWGRVPDAWALRHQCRGIDNRSAGLLAYYGDDGQRTDDSVFRLPSQTIRHLLQNIQKFRVNIEGNMEAHLVATRIGCTVVERACLMMKTLLRDKEVEFFMQSELTKLADRQIDLRWSEEVLSGFRVLRCAKVRKRH